MKKPTPWNLINDSLHRFIPVMLLYVVESAGSSPGRQGFFMAVNATGEMSGSIGGGIMEHKFVEMAKEKLKASDESRVSNIKKQVHDKSATRNQSGMICSGEQTIFLYEVNAIDAVIIRKIIASIEQNKNGTLVLAPEGINFINQVPKKDFEYSYNSEKNWLYKEKTGYKNQLFIIGGGHCSLAFSKFMRTMDFYIRVYDDRDNLPTMADNSFAHEKKIINDYSELAQLIDNGDHHYVVIMTFGYRTDDIALKALLGKNFRYFGLLGSKKKIEKMFDDYRRAGIPEEKLQRIRTPIGLPIKSQTPEEIAISIAAEIILEKNKDL